MRDRVIDDGYEVLLVAAAARRRAAEQVIDLAGGRLVATLDWTETEALTSCLTGRPVLALEAEGVPEEALLTALPHVREAAEALDLPVVVTLTRPQIDVVAGALLGLKLHPLCEVGLAERVGALAVAGRRGGGTGLADRWREGEAERLEKLNEEVARVAELLARLVDRERGGDAPPDDDTGDRHIAFGFAPPAEQVDAQVIRQAIRGRRMRDAFFGGELFGAPAWVMLLDLYAAHLEGGQVSVSSLCIAAAVAPTTALRWITRLTEAGMFERCPDPGDRRRAFLTLSPRTLRGMDGYVAAMRRAGLPFA